MPVLRDHALTLLVSVGDLVEDVVVTLDGPLRSATDTVGDFEIPSEFRQSLPFVVTIIVVPGVIGRAIAPAADGQPFERSR